MPARQRERTTAARSGLCLGGQVLFMMMLALGMASVSSSSSGSPQQHVTKSRRLATGDTEIVLAIKDASAVLEDLRSTATRRNWLSSPLKESLMKSVQVDGVSKELDWKFAGADLDEKGVQLTLHFSNSVSDR